MPGSWKLTALEGSEPHLFGLAFSEELSHRRQDLISEAAAFLTTVPGVDSVVRHGRNRLRLQGRQITQAELEARFSQWWEQERRRKPQWAFTMDKLAVAAHEALAPLGYRMEKWTFNRLVNNDLVHIIELEHRYSDEDDTHLVEVAGGLYLPKVAMLSQGNDSFAGQIVGERDAHIRFLFHHESDVDAGAGGILQFFDETALAYLGRFAGMADLVDDRAGGGPPPPSGQFGAPTQALIYTALGRHEDARRLFQAAFYASEPRSRVQIVELVKKAKCGPLATGARDILTLEEEAALRRWVDSETSMVTQTKGLYATTSVPASKSVLGRLRTKKSDTLDGSLESLQKLTPSAISALEEGVMAQIMRPILPLTFFGKAVREAVETEQQWLPDYRRTLCELLAAYVGFVLRTAEPSAQWAVGGSGELSIKAAGQAGLLEPILRVVDQEQSADAAAIYEVATGLLQAIRQRDPSRFEAVTLQG